MHFTHFYLTYITNLACEYNKWLCGKVANIKTNMVIHTPFKIVGGGPENMFTAKELQPFIIQLLLQKSASL